MKKKTECSATEISRPGDSREYNKQNVLVKINGKRCDPEGNLIDEKDDPQPSTQREDQKKSTKGGRR